MNTNGNYVESCYILLKRLFNLVKIEKFLIKFKNICELNPHCLYQ